MKCSAERAKRSVEIFCSQQTEAEATTTYTHNQQKNIYYIIHHHNCVIHYNKLLVITTIKLTTDYLSVCHECLTYHYHYYSIQCSVHGCDLVSADSICFLNSTTIGVIGSTPLLRRKTADTIVHPNFLFSEYFPLLLIQFSPTNQVDNNGNSLHESIDIANFSSPLNPYEYGSNLDGHWSHSADSNSAYLNLKLYWMSPS